MSKARLIILVLLMFCTGKAWAQWPVDSAKRATLAEAKAKYNDEVLIIDGIPVEQKEMKTKLASFSPQNVFDIIIITKQQFEKQGGFTPLHDAVVITTKTAAISHYQKTLSALSPDYRNYLDANHNSDDGLQYILNSLPLENKGDERVNLLFRLSPEKITNVALTEVNGKKTVIIDIKIDE